MLLISCLFCHETFSFFYPNIIGSLLLLLVITGEISINNKSPSKFPSGLAATAEAATAEAVMSEAVMAEAVMAEAVIGVTVGNGNDNGNGNKGNDDGNGGINKCQ